MKKTAIIFVLAIMTLLLISGCATQAQQSQNQNDYYVPNNNYGGCGVAGPEDTGSVFSTAIAAEAPGIEVF